MTEVMAELAELEDPKMREVNERHGDDHGVNLSKLRALAKRLKTQQELACQLWETGDTAARLVAILICRPKAFERDELDVMLRKENRRCPLHPEPSFRERHRKVSTCRTSRVAAFGARVAGRQGRGSAAGHVAVRRSGRGLVSHN